MIKVFLSSTYGDLEKYRESVRRALRRSEISFVGMEDFPATDSTPLDYCLERLRECDIYLGIIGQIYGSSPPGHEKSYTELEYDEAVAQGMSILIFRSPDEFNVPANLIESDDKRERLKVFRKAVGSTLYVKFENPDHLATEVVIALNSFLSLSEIKAPKKQGAYSLIVHGLESVQVRKPVMGEYGWKLRPNMGETHITKVVVEYTPTDETVPKPAPILLDFRYGEIPPIVTFRRLSGGLYKQKIDSKEFSFADSNEPRFEELELHKKALLVEPGRINLLLSSSSPRAQTVELREGNYVLWVEGSGSANIKGAAIGAATEDKPLNFTLSSDGNVIVTVVGDLVRFQLENGDYPTSFIETPYNAVVSRTEDEVEILLPLDYPR